MKRMFAIMLCLMVVFNCNIPVNAAEFTVACPSGCGGQIVTTKEIRPTYGTLMHCYDHPFCEKQMEDIYEYDCDSCIDCGYERLYNAKYIKTNIIHTNGK